MWQLSAAGGIVLDISAVLWREEAFDVGMLVGEPDQLELGWDDLAADAGDDGVETGVGFAYVVGEFDVADDDLDALGFETVDESGFGEDGVGWGEESDALEVLARGDDGVADVFAYQAGATDYEDVFGDGHVDGYRLMLASRVLDGLMNRRAATQQLFQSIVWFCARSLTVSVLHGRSAQLIVIVFDEHIWEGRWHQDSANHRRQPRTPPQSADPLDGGIAHLTTTTWFA
jgi:hypothetical protein